MSAEVHLLILWESARVQEEAIIADVKEHFSLLAQFDILWSEEKFSENMSRFYGQKLPNGSQKEKQCGRGSFRLLIVRDEAPTYEERSTTAAKELVNSNMFDAKERYRQMTGGGHRVHGTNSVQECRHDLMLLLGKNPDDYLTNAVSDSVQELKKDLEGAAGWENLSHLLNVLNQTSNYVVLRNFEGFPEQYTLAEHGDIDLLCDDFTELAFIVHAKRVFNTSYRRHFRVRIADQDIPFDIRSLEDGYYDAPWARDILNSRTLAEEGFYRPDSKNYFYSLLYHALVHKEVYAADYQKRLGDLASKLNIADAQKVKERGFAKEILDSFMRERNYSYTEPQDISVYFQQEMSPSTSISLSRKMNNVRRWLRHKYRAVRPQKGEA